MIKLMTLPCAYEKENGITATVEHDIKRSKKDEVIEITLCHAATDGVEIILKART